MHFKKKKTLGYNNISGSPKEQRYKASLARRPQLISWFFVTIYFFQALNYSTYSHFYCIQYCGRYKNSTFFFAFNTISYFYIPYKMWPLLKVINIWNRAVFVLGIYFSFSFIFFFCVCLSNRNLGTVLHTKQTTRISCFQLSHLTSSCTVHCTILHPVGRYSQELFITTNGNPFFFNSCYDKAIRIHTSLILRTWAHQLTHYPLCPSSF